MAWSYGFFNSLNGDRLYNADQMSHIFEGLITDGIYESVGNKLAVQPNNGMTIQINTGRGWFGSHWVNNDTPFLKTLENSDVTLNRYCAIGVVVNENESVRSAEPLFKYSEYATNPVKPQPTRTELVKEYIFAYVMIRAGASTINAGDIEDTRFNTDLCGWVTGLIEQIDRNTIYVQQQTLFGEWFDEMKGQLSTDQAGHLQLEIDDLDERVTANEGGISGLNTKMGDTDISDIGDGTVTGGLSQLNSDLSDIIITVEKAYPSQTFAPNAAKAFDLSDLQIPSGYKLLVGYGYSDSVYIFPYREVVRPPQTVAFTNRWTTNQTATITIGAICVRDI